MEDKSLTENGNGSSFGIGESDSTTLSSNQLQDETSIRPSTLKATNIPPTTSNQTGKSGDIETAHRLLRAAKSKIEELKAQIIVEKEETAKVREEYSRFRVRSELARQQRELEIASLSEVNLKFKQYNVVSHDIQSELDMLRRRFETIEKERAESRIELVRLNELLEKERQEKKELLSEVNEWRQKSDTVGPEAVMNVKMKMQEELNEARLELKLVRERTAKLLEEKDQELIQTRIGSDAATEKAYLRDVILKYLASSNDSNTKTSMEAAIASVLRFTPTEVDFIREQRRRDSNWKPTGWKNSFGM